MSFSSTIEALLTSAMILAADVPHVDQRELTCMAQNIYHEARGETVEGQRAVAHVTLNRVAHQSYPDTICGVVYQRRQFSWTTHRPAVHEPAAYENALMVALSAMQGQTQDPTLGATHYFDHSRVTPGWSRSFERTRVIGGHTFMKE